jgi:hypothetical protein
MSLRATVLARMASYSQHSSDTTCQPSVIGGRINFVESGPVQFLPVDWRAGDVGPANSSISIWSKWVISVSQLQELGSPATESTSNDGWGEGGSNNSMCQPPTFVQMQVPFWVGKPAYRVGLHTILALSYSIIGNSSWKMWFLYCDENIDFIFMTLAYNLFCRVTSEDVFSMNLFTILGTIGRMT